MRVHNRKWNIVGRRVIALLLLCGLLLPSLQKVNADSVIYEYKRIEDATGLPTDNQWNDYFIAWEDLDDKNKVWFTDYHWYTADGDNNYDVGGSHWMEYKAASTLPNSTAGSFTSQDSLGHMQIKYAGRDEDNGNSPMYYIRVSKMNGGYIYFTEYEPTTDAEDAEPFTFQDKGDVFHIFVNISGKADRYLTRDGQYLETTESSSSGGGDHYRPLRVYRKTFTVQKEETPADTIGKVKLYEYSWVNTVDELMDLADSKQWTNVLLAWEDSDGSKNNPNKVWYTKEVWYDTQNKPNYNNDGANIWTYYSNDYIGSDGYGSPQGETFLLPSQVGHFQVKCVDWDDDNPVHGETNWGDPIDSPVFQFRFDIGHGRYIYIGNNAFYEDAEDAEDYTVQLRLGQKDADDRLGSVWIINNITSAQDELFCRYGNYFSIGNWNHSGYWEFPFRLYTCREIEYDAIVKSFTVGKGATYAIDRQLVLGTGVTITVEDGGVLTVDKELLNNGKIIIKNGGTVIVNEGGYIMSYDKDAEGSITLDGGNLIIMDGAKVICDQNGGVLKADNGSTILNRGFLLVGNILSMNHNSCLKNAPNATLLLGGKLAKDRGGVDGFTIEEIVSRVERGGFVRLLSNKSKIIGIDEILESPDMEDLGGIDTGSGSNTGSGSGIRPGGGLDLGGGSKPIR